MYMSRAAQAIGYILVVSILALFSGCGGSSGGGGDKPTPEGPSAQIDSPATDVTIFQGESLLFKGTAFGVSPYRYSWSFGGGATDSTSEDPGNVPFSTPGTYTVTLTVTDGNGLTEKASRTVTVNQKNDSTPVVSISTPADGTTITSGQSLNFQGTVSGGDSPITYTWNFGGGAANASVEDPGNVVFTSAGTFNVSFSATDADGDTASKSIKITVNTVTLSTWYRDSDNDGYGNSAGSMQAATQPSGYVANNTDCNDGSAAVHPGAVETVGNGIDENCDGYDLKRWYRDADSDGYGNPASSTTANTQPSGYVANNTDCSDSNAAIHPGATDTAGNGVDENCDGYDLKIWYRDADSDGYGNPSSSTTANTQPSGYVANSTDCNDGNASIHPGATETVGNGVDENCDGYDLKRWYRDADSDGYGNPSSSTTANTQPSGYVANNTDCSDSSAVVHPGATEICGDGIDQDCSGSDASCSPVTIRVPADYQTIQSAVDASKNGDTILVSNGTYTENVNVTKQVVIRSENGYSSTTVVAVNTSDHVFDVQADNVTIDGFTVFGATAGTSYPYSASIYVGSGFDNCTIIKNRCGYDADHRSVFGISLYASDNNLVENNIAMNNVQVGIYLGPFSSNNMITGNTSSRNLHGMYIANIMSNNTITKNIFSENTSCGLYLDNSDGCSIYLNSLINNSSHNAYAYGSSCTWNSPTPLPYSYNNLTYSGYLGNYFGDYVSATGGNDSDGNGIGNIAYVVDTTNSDNDPYPLWQIHTVYSQNTTVLWYLDSDGDGYSSGTVLSSTTRPGAEYYLASELLATSGDLYDDDPESHPGAVEVCDDSRDNDCDGFIDEGCGTSSGYVSLSSSTPQMSGITFDYLNAAYYSGNAYLPYWAINSTGGYMEFSFIGQLDFCFHAFGEPSNGTSQSYIDLFINGVLYLTNLLIDHFWQWYQIASSLFTTGVNSVKIVLVGITDFCINEVSTAVHVTTWYLDADGDGYGDPAHSVLAGSQPSGYVDNNSDSNDGDAGIYPGATYTNSVGMTFNLIPAGTFMMGSPSGELGRQSDETPHEVTITKPFYIQTTEVTQAQWQAVMGVNPAYFTGNANRPVERITWNKVQEFIIELNKRGEGTYRLPTEAEWEYAARSGSGTAFANGEITHTSGDDPVLSAIGFYSFNSGSATHSVALKIPNAWGLYDMHGNVSEMCSDWYGTYLGTAEIDPTGPLTGTGKVIRGGSWWQSASGCRSAYRDNLEPQYAGNYVGLRLVRVSTVLPFWYRDADGDGFGDPAVLTRSATQPSGYVSNNSDCNDGSSSIHPGAAEICGDGIDQDCNGGDLACALYTWYRDADNDGYGDPGVSVQADMQPPGYVANHGDLNDNNASIHPGAYEIINNGIDEDCDGGDLVYPVSSIIRVPVDYSTIQAAIDAADAGDVVLVAAGTFTENINITKQVIVRSEVGYEQTTVVASSAGDHVFDVRANNVTIEGFTIYGAGQSYSGIYLGPYPSGARYCTISHNRVGVDAGHRNYNGLYLNSASYNTVSWNILTSDQNYGISLAWYSDYNTIENNTVSSCAGGIDIALESDSNTVRANRFISNSSIGVFITSSSAGNTISGNFISSSYTGIGLSESAYGNLIEKNSCVSSSGAIALGVGAHHNTIRENSCDGSTYFGISISGVTNNTIYLNSFTNSTAGNVYLGDNQKNTWHSPSMMTYYYNNAEHTGYLGNYYDDYVAATGGNDNDGNGIGSLPYPIGATHADEDVYPLWKEPAEYSY